MVDISGKMSNDFYGRYFIYFSFFVSLFFLGVTLRANGLVLSYDENIVFTPEEAPEREVALVFGGGMIDNHTMSSFQFDRVVRAIELYQLGKVQTLVMTGDDGEKRFDEVSAMREMAIAQGVDKDDIVIDGKSFRTYTSCLRAAEVLDLKRVIAISQDFHLPRIRYFCERFGVETVGLAADAREYEGFFKVWIREILARVKGWWQLEITMPPS